MLNERVAWPAEAERRGLPDGTYTLGIRPHHITPKPRSEAAVRLAGKVLVTELSGSESVIHFELQDETWVSQSHGIHAFEVGAHAELFMDVGRCMYFGQNEELIAA